MNTPLRWLLARPQTAKKGEINFALVDRFTLVHLAIGFGYGWFGLSFGVAILFAVTWEFLENPLKVHFSFLFPHATADTVRNMVGDVSAVAAGWYLRHFLST